MPTPLEPHTLVYELAAASDPQIAPDGTRIVYTLAQADAASGTVRSQIWCCDMDGSNQRMLLWAAPRNRLARWAPDGRRLAYVSTQRGWHSLRVLTLDGNEAWPMTDYRQPITAVDWSPDGSHIAYSIAVDLDNLNQRPIRPGDLSPVRVTRRIDYKQDGFGYVNNKRSQIYVIDVSNNQRKKLSSSAFDYSYPQWSPDGTKLIARRGSHNGMHSQLALIDIESGAEELIMPENGTAAIYAWSPEGTRILIGGELEKTNQLDFFLYSTTEQHLQRLTDNLPCQPYAGYPTLVEPSQPVWVDSSHALFHAMQGGASALYMLDTNSGAVEELYRWQGQNTGLSADRSGHYFALAHGSLERSGEIVVFDREERKAQIISSNNSEVLAEHPPARFEQFSVKRGDFSIDAWLLFPPGFKESKRYPLVLDIHGGPHNFYGYVMNPVQQCLAGAGFLVLFANPRGSSSYGRAFTQAVVGDWGGEDFQDLMAVVDEAIQRPYVDAERLGIYGYSYGGYMTAWTIGQTNRFKAAVCGAPVFDMVSFYGTSDIGHVFGEYEFGGPPHERKDWYDLRSPSTYAHQVRTPTLIVHGEADDRCPIGQGEQMFAMLHKAGCEVEFVRYPEGTHLMLRNGPAPYRIDYLTRVRDWFLQHLAEQE